MCFTVHWEEYVVTRKIRINKIPPGFTPLHIREAWVGVEIETVSDEETKVHRDDLEWTSHDSHDALMVTGVNACLALINAGKDSAAQFWGNPFPPEYLRFDPDCYEVVYS